ncbi:MAG: hypothetical protein GY861_06620 [bacterium]|nr:hypothetical protein [bacterium]
MKIELNTEVVAWDDGESQVDSATGFYAGLYENKHLIADGNLNTNSIVTVTMWDYCKEVETPKRDEELYESLKLFTKAFPTAGEAMEALDKLTARRAKYWLKR